mgnify:CR=1 FL=1
MALAGSQTEKNLKDAFAGESQARNKYTYFASVAKKEGFEKVAHKLFRRRHAAADEAHHEELKKALEVLKNRETKG